MLVQTNLAEIEEKWTLLETIDDSTELKLKKISNPEFIIATNMISVGIDVSRFNTIVINSMPRNIAEYIQASSRVARDEDGVVNYDAVVEKILWKCPHSHNLAIPPKVGWIPVDDLAASNPKLSY